MSFKLTTGRKIYIVASTIFLVGLCMIMILPFLKVVAESLSSKTYLDKFEVIFLPKGFNIEAYKLVFKDPSMVRAFGNSLFITIIGTALNLVMTVLFAYPLSRPEYVFRKQMILLVVFTMIFSAPMIPNYLWIRSLGLDNSLWSVILPGMISGFNFLVMRSFFMGLPGELIDASRIDGCSELRILTNIVLPLSKPTLATVGLFYAVAHWNALGGPLIYLRDPKLYTLQIKLYWLIQSSIVSTPDAFAENFSPQNIKMATIVIVTVPILLIYPFLQKYFIKGATLGSIKE